jgi:hypothetical protein
MPLEVWFREDVARTLTALAAAGSRQGPEYHKALFDVAIAFGVTTLVGQQGLPQGFWGADAEPVGLPAPRRQRILSDRET